MIATPPLFSTFRSRNRPHRATCALLSALLIPGLLAFGLLALPLVLAATPARADTTSSGASGAGTLGFGLDAAASKTDKKAPMVLESDQLVYDYDNTTVAASGKVKIYYDGNTLEADRVIYNQKTQKMFATGNVKLIDKSGTVATGDEMDITQDFANGFVTALRLDTPTQTHFAAEKAYRRDGKTTTFYRGVYTACEPCREHPDKKPVWQVRAARIIVDHNEHMVYFKQASLEFLGMPIAYFPAFSAPDPTVKRKSGFLFPSAGYTSSLGAYVSTPYFWALAPNYDITFSPAIYTNQGFLADAEWRHRTEYGQYTLEMAGIDQLNPQDLYVLDKRNGGDRDFRGGVHATGDYNLSEKWSAGFDVTAMTDRTFASDYGVLGKPQNNVAVSTAYLTGLSDRNYFDARGYYFEQLNNDIDPQYDQDRQAVVAPVIDSNHIFDDSVLGGQLSLKSNLTHLSRSETDFSNFDNDNNTLSANDRIFGLKGDYTRLSSQLTWQASTIGPVGMVFKPFAFIHGDAFSLDQSQFDADQAMTGIDANGNFYRDMPGAGLEWRWPIMMAGLGSSVVLEPIAQVIVRPDEQLAGRLPNEDAQSLVFDDSNLFSWDKFSGYDREEGGTRVNVGFHYLANIGDSAATIQGIIGQSYQIAGLNSFSVNDITGTGLVSGLQDNVSDIVAGTTLDTGSGYFLTARGRFDHDTYAVNRAEVTGTGKFNDLTASASYIYLRDQPAIGLDEPTNTVSTKASYQFTPNWRLFGSLAYDIHAATLASSGLGVAYDDECTTFSLAYSSTLSSYTDLTTNKQILLSLQLRTLGGTTLKGNLDNLSSN